MPEFLTKRDVATLRGVPIETISRYLAGSRARLRAGLPLRPMDMPIQDDTRYGHPLWRADGPVAAWIPRGHNATQAQPEDATP